MLTGEELKTIYNENYKKDKDNWSETNLRQTNRIANRIHRFISEGSIKPSSFLDVGSAKGHQAESFRKIGYRAYGLDYSDVAVDKAQELFPSNTFIVMDGFNPKFDMEFDLILMKGFSGTNTHDLEFVKKSFSKNILNTYLRKDSLFFLFLQITLEPKKRMKQ